MESKAWLATLRENANVYIVHHDYGGRSSYELANVFKITPSGRIKVIPQGRINKPVMEFNADGWERAQARRFGFKDSLAEFTEELQARLKQEREAGDLIRQFDAFQWKKLTLDQLRRIHSIIQEADNANVEH